MLQLGYQPKDDIDIHKEQHVDGEQRVIVDAHHPAVIASPRHHDCDAYATAMEGAGTATSRSALRRGVVAILVPPV